MMRRTLLWTLSLASIAVIGMVVLAQIYLEPWLKNEILKQAHTHLDGELTLDSVSLTWLPPVGVRLQGIELKLNHPQLHLQMAAAQARVGFLSALTGGPLRVHLALEKPGLELFSLSAGSTATPSAGSASPAPAVPTTVPMGVEFDVVIRDAWVRNHLPQTPETEVDQIQAHLKGLDVRGPWEIDFKSEVKSTLAGMKVQLPIEVAAQLDRPSETVFHTGETRLSIGGLASRLKGQMDLATGAHDWDIDLNIPDLSALPTPPQFLPTGQWKGQIAAQIHAVKTNQIAAWTAAGKLQASDLSGQVKVNRPDLRLVGQVSSRAQVEFRYAQTLEVPIFSFALQLQPLEIAYKKLFAKPSGVPLALTAEGVVSHGNLNLKKAEFRLDRLAASANGFIPLDTKGLSDVHISVPTTDLAGLEKYLLPLANSPLKGSLQVEAQVKGQASRPDALIVQVNPLVLNNFEASVRYESEDKKMQIEGPIQANLRALVAAAGTNVTKANVSGTMNATHMQVDMKDTFHKAKGQPLTLTIAAEDRSGSLNLRSLLVTLPAGTASGTGTVRDLQRPQLNLAFKTSALDFVQLSAMLPALQPYKLSGSVASTGQVAGVFDLKKGIQESPLNFKGNVKVDLKEYAYQPAPAAPIAPSKKEKAPASKPEPLLPNWPILRKAIVQHEINIGRVMFKDLPIHGVHWKGTLTEGQLQGHARVDQIFEGMIDAPAIGLSLIVPEPTTRAKAQFSKFNIGQAVDWAMPDWKNQVKGIAAGTVDCQVPFPSRTDFIDQTQAQGEVRIQQGRLSSLKFQQLAKEQLSKIPGLGDKANVKADDVLLDISTQYNLQKSKMMLSHFLMKTPQNDELQADGWLNLNKEVDLKGTAYLTNPPVSGSIREANSDKSGRLVLPIKIQGSILNPQVGFAQETVQKLLSNTARREADKLKEKFQQQGQEGLKKQGEQVLDNLKDQFKGLLGH